MATPDIADTATTQKKKSTPKRSSLHTFSAATCIALLPDLDEAKVELEFKYLLSIDSSYSAYKARTTREMRDVLLRSLSKGAPIQFNNSLSNLEQLTSNINTTLHTATNAANELRESAAAATNLKAALDSATEVLTELRESARTANDILKLDDAVPSEATSRPFSSHAAPSSSNGTEYPQCPVRLCSDIDIDIPFEDVRQSIAFNQKHPGGRSTAYFGSLPYKYGRFTHHPIPYPESPVFDRVFHELSSLGVTKEEYTCLCTLYEDGGVTIPLHQDNEKSIDPESTIYTVSFGATRELKVYNTSGPLKEHSIPLEHGSVHAMSRASQEDWRHGIGRENSVREPRISLTFRRLLDPSETPLPPSPAPPITRPPAQTPSRSSRVLLLTDSILSHTPESVFEQVPGHTCVKRTCYQLCNVFDHEAQFKHASTVIFSNGINDLSRYGKTAHTLMDIVNHRLKQCCKQNPNTNFVFNSITHARDRAWLNHEVDIFNDYIYNLSKIIHNLSFYDSHAMIINENLRTVWDWNGNGIHLCYDVQRLVVRGLVNSVGKLTRPHSGSPRFREFRWLFNAMPLHISFG